MKGLFTFRRALLILGLVIPSALLWAMASVRSWQRHTLPLIGDFNGMAFSPIEPLLAYDMETPALGWEVRVSDAWTRHTLWRMPGEYESFAFSPDGRILAGVGGQWEEKSSHITVWEAHTGKRLHTFSLPWPTSSISFSGDGRSLLVAKRDGLVVFDTVIWRRTRAIVLPRFMMASTLTPIAKLPSNGLYRATNVIDVTPDAQSLFVELTTMRPKTSLRPHERNDEVVKNQVYQYDARGTSVWKQPIEGQFGGISDDRHVLAVSTRRNTQIEIYELPSRKLLHTLKAAPEEEFDANLFGGPMLFSHNGTRLFTNIVVHHGAGKHFFMTERLDIWDLTSGRVVRSLKLCPKPNMPVLQGALTADDSLLAVGTYDGQRILQLWRVK